MNLVVRGIAQTRQVPFVDYHRELLPLPGHGLAPDGVHPNVYSQGACHFSEAGLVKGYNVRNLITLEALDRVRRVVVDAEPAPDPPEAPRLTGAGSLADPFVVPNLPFTHGADTAASPHRALDVYQGCGSGQDESGPEWVYRLDLATTTPIRAMVLDVGAVDIDLHILAAGATTTDGAASACIARNDTLLQGTLAAGSYLVTLDSFVSAGTARSGPYQLVVLACEPGDPRCAAPL
jgi:hypothetical protein